jgi:hypothetical protein
MAKINPATPSETTTGYPGSSNQGNRLTPELVSQVADKVYAMLIAELRIEKERHRLESSGRDNLPGGRGWNQ